MMLYTYRINMNIYLNPPHKKQHELIFNAIPCFLVNKHNLMLAQTL